MLNEEEKVSNSDTNIKNKTKKYLLRHKNKSFNEREINSNICKSKQLFSEINISAKSLKNNYKKYKKGIFGVNSRNILNQQNGDDNKYKIEKYDNKVSLDKEEIFNAFIFFQEILKREDYKNRNRDYIKTRLFEFILQNKNINNKKENNDNFTINQNLFNTNDCLHLYTKTTYGFNINQNINKIMPKSFSFSFSNNDGRNIFLNFFGLSKENIKDSPKSVSQIFDDLLLMNNKIKDKTVSEDDSKFSNHEYSFDRKNKEKNEISFQSIPDKEKPNDKFFDFNNNFFNDNYNTYKKEFECRKSFITNKILNNKSNRTEDLLIESNYKKYEKENIRESNSMGRKEENEDLNKFLYDKDLFKEKLTISPSNHYKENIYIQNQNFKIKNKESFIEPEKTTINEIKVNKSRILNNKENLINEKLKELDEEIRQFHEERKKMELIKDEYEKLKIKLLKDIKEFNMKKEIKEKYFGGDYDRLKNISKTETRLIMSITQHNKSLILNNEKKTETINLLKKRIYQLENIIRNKNKNILDNKKIHEGIIKSIRENNINFLIKKRNDTNKRNKCDKKLIRKNINLKKNIASCSLEKINENNKKDNLRHKNMKLNNNLNKLYFDSKNNKKYINISYSGQPNFKNNIMTSKLLNFNNLINTGKRYPDTNLYGYNLTATENLIKKNSYNNTIGGNINNSKNSKGNVKIEHSNLYIFENLLKNEKEKERNNKYNRIKLNINSVRDFGDHKKIMKKLKTEFHNNDEKVKDKYKRIIKNNQFNGAKYPSKNYQKSQGKNPISKRLNLKIESNKNKGNSNFFSLNKINDKNNKIKNIASQERNTNTINYENNSSDDKINKKENNSPDNKVVNNKFDNKNMNIKDADNVDGFDFNIPNKYKSMDNGEIINNINADGKIINIYNNNKKEIIFQSGVKKQIFPDGYQLINFPNGDMKQKFVGKEEKVIYFYSETNTVQTTFKNGLNIFKFNNGQIEKHYPDGTKYIFYTNGLRKKISKDGKEEVSFYEEQKKFGEENNNNNQIVDII